MKKWICIVLLLSLIPHVFAEDLIITKNNKQYKGKVIRVVDLKNDKGKGLVVRTMEGNMVVIPRSNISKIYRDNNRVIDFNENMQYRIERKRPFLPFIVLSVATGAYAVNRFQEYQRIHDIAEKQKEEAGVDPETINTNDQKTALAWGIVSGLFCAGSFYIALKPMEVKVPIGRISLDTQPNRVRLSLHF